MTKLLPIVVCSAILFAACQPAANPVLPPRNASSSSSFSSAASAMLNSEARHGGDLAWDVVAAWSADLSWSAPVAGTNADSISIDADHLIDAGKMQVRTSTAVVTAVQYNKYFVKARGALDTDMLAKGWKHHLLLDADGGSGTQWGYIHTDEDGTRFVIISAQCTNWLATEKSDEMPPMCQTYAANVTLTDTLVAGDDM